MINHIDGREWRGEGTYQHNVVQILDGKSHILDPITVLHQMLPNFLFIGLVSAHENEEYFILPDGVSGVFPTSGFQAFVCQRFETHPGNVITGGLKNKGNFITGTRGTVSDN